MRVRGLALAMAAGLPLLAAASAGAQAPPAQPARGVPQTVSELAAVCAIGPDSPEHTAASFFCRGFLAGVGQYHAAMHPIGRGRPPIFCVPDPPPTLRAAAGGFVAWAAANPQHAGEAAVDGLMRYAAATWPCPPEERRQARRRAP
ncbi:MAG: hypothetical protein K2X74_04570 [Acetobacteraceae bacterium]|nr:hypothetical protein [Acetobacteraceae bacterium]